MREIIVRTGLAVLLLIASIGTPAVAQPIDQRSAADASTIDAMANSVFSSLRKGQSAEALRGFFGSNPLVTGKATELQILTSQIDSLIGVLGPIGECQVVERKSRGTLLEVRQYLCQHRHSLSRWTIVAARTTTGWVGANLSFDDKITQSLEN